MVVYDLSKTRGDTGKPVGSGDRGSFTYRGKFEFSSTRSSSGGRGGGRGNSHRQGESDVEVRVDWDTTINAYNKFTHRPKGPTKGVQGPRIVFKNNLINVGKYRPDKLSSVEVYFLKSKNCQSGHDDGSDTRYPFLVIFNESRTGGGSSTGDKVYFGNPGKSGDSKELGNWSKWEELEKGTSRTVEKSLIEKLSLIEKKCGTLGDDQKARRVRVYKILKGEDLEEKVKAKEEEETSTGRDAAVPGGPPETEAPGPAVPVPVPEVTVEVVTLPVTVPETVPVPVPGPEVTGEEVPGPVPEVPAMPVPEVIVSVPGVTGVRVPGVSVPVPPMPLPAMPPTAMPLPRVTVPVPVPRPRGSLSFTNLAGDKGEAVPIGARGVAGHPSSTIGEGSVNSFSGGVRSPYTGGLLVETSYETSDKTSEQSPGQRPVAEVSIPAVLGPRGSLREEVLEGDQGEAGPIGDKGVAGPIGIAGAAGPPSSTIVEGSVIAVNSFSGETSLSGPKTSLVETSEQSPVLEVTEAVSVPVTEAGPRGFLGGEGLTVHQGEAGPPTETRGSAHPPGSPADKGKPTKNPETDSESPDANIGEDVSVPKTDSGDSTSKNQSTSFGDSPGIPSPASPSGGLTEPNNNSEIPGITKPNDIELPKENKGEDEEGEAAEDMPVALPMIGDSRETNMPGLESWLIPAVQFVSFLGKGVNSLLKGSASQASTTTSSSGSDTDNSGRTTFESPVDGGGSVGNTGVNGPPGPTAPAITSNTADGSDNSRGDTISSLDSSSTVAIGEREAGSSSNVEDSPPAAPGSCPAPGGRARRATEYRSVNNCGPGSGIPISPGSDGETPNESQTPVIIGSAVGVTVALAAVSTGGYLWHSLGTMTVRDMIAYF